MKTAVAEHKMPKVHPFARRSPFTLPARTLHIQDVTLQTAATVIMEMLCGMFMLGVWDLCFAIGTLFGWASGQLYFCAIFGIPFLFTSWILIRATWKLGSWIVAAMLISFGIRK